MLVAKECLTLWREGLMQGICAMPKFVDNGHLSRHGCCHRYYHHNEYAQDTTHVFSLYYAVSFGVFANVTRLRQYTTIQRRILTAMPLQCYCSAFAVGLQSHRNASAKVHFGAHYMRSSCAVCAHRMRI